MLHFLLINYYFDEIHRSSFLFTFCILSSQTDIPATIIFEIKKKAPGGVEPSTFRLLGGRSNQLSYRARGMSGTVIDKMRRVFILSTFNLIYGNSSEI